MGSDAANHDEFGHSVAVSGDAAVVGAWRHHSSKWGPEGGAAYVFERDQGGAGAWGEVATLHDLTTFGYDWFGYSVAVSGDTVVVGAPRAEPSTTGSCGVYGCDHGMAYVFERSRGAGGTWVKVAELVPRDPQSKGEFGYSVAISGDTAVVGAPQHDATGAAYVFERDGGGAHAWGQVAKLIAGGVAFGAELGHSVAISGDRVVIGAWRDHAGSSLAGSAYVFERNLGGANAWGEAGKLTASDGQSLDWFGSSVAVDGDTTVVGAHGADGDCTIGDTVRALAFDPGTSILYGVDASSDELITIDTATGAGTPIGPLGFGAVTGLAFDSGTQTLYGADESFDQLIAIDTATGAGAAIGSFGFSRVRALAFDPGTSTLYGVDDTTDKLITIDTLTGAGSAVGPVGAYSHVWGLTFDSATNTLYGAAENLLGSMWSIRVDTSTGAATGVGPIGFDDVRGLACDGGVGSLYGSEITTDQLIVIDSASGSGAGIGGVLLDAGSAYLFAIPFATETYCTAGTSASGCQALISSVGSASATAVSGFDLVAGGVEGAKDGMFFFGTSGRQASPWGNGTSYQCVVPPLQRLGPLGSVGTAGACDGWFSQDLNALWCSSCPSPHLNPEAGTVVQAQLWYRDPLNTSNQTTSLSDAIEFQVGP
jgi:hypothetical protein